MALRPGALASGEMDARQWARWCEQQGSVLTTALDATITGDWTFTGTINFDGTALQIDGTQVLTSQQTAVANAAAATATNPSAPTPYTPHSSGGVTVTSDSATDLDTVAAALDTLVDEVTTYETAISALIVDVEDIRTQLNDLLGKLRTHGVIAT